jgi:hypothetical protein
LLFDDRHCLINREFGVDELALGAISSGSVKVDAAEDGFGEWQVGGDADEWLRLLLRTRLVLLLFNISVRAIKISAES